jgi:hypothetical protein
VPDARVDVYSAHAGEGASRSRNAAASTAATSTLTSTSGSFESAATLRFRFHWIVGVSPIASARGQPTARLSTCRLKATNSSDTFAACSPTRPGRPTKPIPTTRSSRSPMGIRQVKKPMPEGFEPLNDALTCKLDAKNLSLLDVLSDTSRWIGWDQRAWPRRQIGESREAREIACPYPVQAKLDRAD